MILIKQLVSLSLLMLLALGCGTESDDNNSSNNSSSNNSSSNNSSSTRRNRVGGCSDNPNVGPVTDCPYGECEEPELDDNTLCDQNDALVASDDNSLLCRAGADASYYFDVQTIKSDVILDAYYLVVTCEDSIARKTLCTSGVKTSGTGEPYTCAQ